MRVDPVAKGGDADVGWVGVVVDARWRAVGDEDVSGGHVGNDRRIFLLGVENVAAAAFVAHAAFQADERCVVDGGGGEVEVGDAQGGEVGAVVVVAVDADGGYGCVGDVGVVEPGGVEVACGDEGVGVVGGDGVGDGVPGGGGSVSARTSSRMVLSVPGCGASDSTPGVVCVLLD